MSSDVTVDVLIPTCRPDGKLLRLLKRLDSQSYPVNKVIIINTGSDGPKDIINRLSEEKVRVVHRTEVHYIDPSEFDHGGTRRKLVELSDSDYFICMTMDAVPYDDELVENLLKPLLENSSVSVSYARQLPAPEAKLTERYIRDYNYTKTSVIKRREDIDTMGIKAFFCSNVCACYRRSSYDQLGGFVARTIFNEDMIFARSVLDENCAIAYAAEAKVIHSHNYSGMDQLHRNFDLAVSQTEHPEVFGGIRSEGEGLTLVKGCVSFLLENEKAYMIPGFIWNCGCRYLGFLLGKNYKYLPFKMVLKLTSNKGYWMNRLQKR